MKTTEEQNTENGKVNIAETPVNKRNEGKREVISISVTAEEKRRINVEAIKDYNTTVSELIRSRMFIKADQTDAELKAPTVDNDELEAYKEVVNQLKEEVTNLKSENSRLVLEANTKTTNEEVTTETAPKKENVLLLEFAPESMNYIQKVKSHRDEVFKGLTEPKEIKNFVDFDKYFKTLLLRGLRRSYNNGALYDGTGLSIGEVQEIAKNESIDKDEI